MPKWSAAAKKWLKSGTMKKTAEALDPPVTAPAVRLWREGESNTPPTRVDQLLALARAEGVELTHADFGRPDLSPDATKRGNRK